MIPASIRTFGVKLSSHSWSFPPNILASALESLSSDHGLFWKQESRLWTWFIMQRKEKTAFLHIFKMCRSPWSNFRQPSSTQIPVYRVPCSWSKAFTDAKGIQNTKKNPNTTDWREARFPFLEVPFHILFCSTSKTGRNCLSWEKLHNNLLQIAWDNTPDFQ